MWEGGGEQSGPYKFNKARSVRRYANRTVDYTSNGERKIERERERKRKRERLTRVEQRLITLRQLTCQMGK